MNHEDVYPLIRVRVVHVPEYSAGVSRGDIGVVLYKTDVGARIHLLDGERAGRKVWMPSKNLEPADDG